VKVLVAMSGGVDSSVAAALLQDAGHEVVGVTLKLWGGSSDRGCCSVADVDDARRVADRLGIDHHVFNFSTDFDRHVVEPYVAAHAGGLTPNPCIECNRHLKFDRLAARAERLGFDALATGHHARVVRTTPDGGGSGSGVSSDDTWRIARGVDRRKDQSYVLYMLGPATLARLLLPVGELTKAQVREEASRRGLRTAAKPDSQDVCFIQSTGGGEAFLGERLALRPGRVVDAAGRAVGAVPAVQLVTIGQRKGLGLAGGHRPRYVLDVDPERDVVVVGDRDDLDTTVVELDDLIWSGEPVAGPVLAQCSAHGEAAPAEVDGSRLRWCKPRRRVAPGQAVVLYRGDEVIGGGIAAREPGRPRG
jgi:tRNA-specific 2-thiouridylase